MVLARTFMILRLRSKLRGRVEDIRAQLDVRHQPTTGPEPESDAGFQLISAVTLARAAWVIISYLGRCCPGVVPGGR